jgi:hypothetical protein
VHASSQQGLGFFSHFYGFHLSDLLTGSAQQDAYNLLSECTDFRVYKSIGITSAVV